MMVTRKVRTRGISIFWDKMRLTTSRALPILKLKQNDAGTHSIKFARAPRKSSIQQISSRLLRIFDLSQLLSPLEDAEKDEETSGVPKVKR